VALKQDVQEQNASTKAAILATARTFADGFTSLAWLNACLLSRKLSHKDGILVRVDVTPGQEGDLIAALWLTSSREFWEVSAVVSRSNAAIVQIERIEDVAQSISIDAHQRGTGKTFGYLALEVLGGKVRN
jgi:hypothetical protein